MAKNQDLRNAEAILEELVAYDFKVVQYSEYHFRINGRLDIWPTTNKWYDIKMHKKGTYSNLKKFVLDYFPSFKVPQKKEFKDQEIVICAAIKMHDGYIVRGHRHSDCFRTIEGIPRYKDSKLFGREQGFVTSRNRFVNRIEGCKIQKAAGIKSRLEGAEAYLYGELYSEDLY